MKTPTTALRSTLILIGLSLVSCGKSSQSGPAGSYRVDAVPFAETMADALIETGKVPAELRATAVSQLRKAKFDLDLNDDGSFSFAQAVNGEKKVYTGTWEVVGTAINLHQTHEDGNEVADAMTGTVGDDRLEMAYEEAGVEMNFTMLRKGQPAAPPR